MRIGINGRFYSASRITGVERFAREVVSRMVQKASEHEFVLFVDADQVAQVPTSSHLEVVCCKAGRGRLARHFWEQLSLPRLARRYEVDILLNPINTAPLAFSRNVLVLHDLGFRLHPQFFGRTFRFLYNMIIPSVAKRALEVVTVSEHARAEIIMELNISPPRVRRIYPGGGEAWSERITKNPVPGLPEPYVLFIGSLDPRKNLTGLISAFERLVMRRPELPHHLVVVGASNSNFRKLGLSDLGGRVVFPGYISDDLLPDLYAGASAFAYPSFYEGFGLPPLEAMACGTPVVVSNAASLPEVVGDAALMVDPHDVEGLALTLERVLTDRTLAAELRAKGRRRAECFAWDRTVDQLLESIDKLGPSAKLAKMGNRITR